MTMPSLVFLGNRIRTPGSTGSLMGWLLSILDCAVQKHIKYHISIEGASWKLAWRGMKKALIGGEFKAGHHSVPISLQPITDHYLLLCTVYCSPLVLRTSHHSIVSLQPVANPGCFSLQPITDYHCSFWQRTDYYCFPSRWSLFASL